MSGRRKGSWVAIVAAAALWAAPVAGQGPAAVADAYLAHYVAGEIRALEPLLAEDAVFEDPSQELHGRQEVLRGLEAAFSTFTILGFDVERRIGSDPRHVLFVGRVRFDLSGDAAGAPGKTLAFDVPFAVSLRIVDGRVVRHVDFVDARAYARQYRDQTRGDDPGA